jgi:hypothetical protein
MNLIFGIFEIFFGAVIYFLVLFLIKGISKGDLLIIKRGIKRILSKS